MSTFAQTIDAITVEQLIERGSSKWTTFPGKLGAWIAEMDFGLAQPISDALAGLDERLLYGYASPTMLTDLRAATAAYQERRYGWSIPAEAVCPTSDVLHGLGLVLDGLLEPGRPVVTLTPCYMPFATLPTAYGRDLIQVPMDAEADGWAVPYDRLAEALAGGGLLVLSSPFNPLGKVFTRDELQRIAAIVDAAGARVYADEIHAPLTFSEAQHVPYASVSEAAAAHSVTAVSASKAWNLAGLKCAQLIFTNPSDLGRWTTRVVRRAAEASNPGIVAGIAAYNEGQPWLDDALAYLDVNRKLAHEALNAIDGVEAKPLHGTYLQLVDFRGLELPGSPRDFLFERADLALTDGALCGDAGRGFVRINLATPTPILREILDRIADAVTSH